MRRQRVYRGCRDCAGHQVCGKSVAKAEPKRDSFTVKQQVRIELARWKASR